MFNSSDCGRFYDFLGHSKETEVRLIHPKREKPAKSIFVHSREEFIATCETWNDKMQVYAGVCERQAGGTEAKDVTLLNKVWVDLDPVREKDKDGKDTAATDEEKKEAGIVAERINAEVFSGKAVVIDSGNGYQLYERIPEVPICDENRKEVNDSMKLWTNGLQKKYNSDKVKIDSVYELARIMRVPGTVNIKGDNTPERPHRISAFVKWDLSEPDATLSDAILTAQKPSANLVEGSVEVVAPKIANLIKSDFKINRLYNGDISGYQSRSEAEFALAFRLMCYGYDDSEVSQIIGSSRLGKWDGETENYRVRTLERAREKAKEYQTSKLTRSTHPTEMRCLNYDELMAVSDDGQPFLIKNHVYGGRIGALIGVSSGGKTFIGLDMAAAVASGQTFLGEPTIQGNVGYLDGENGPRSIKRRLSKICAGRNLSNLPGVYVFPDPIRLDDNPELLIDEVRKRNIIFLIIDGIQRWVGIDLDMDNKGMSDFFVDVLEKIAALGITVMIIHHLKKIGNVRFRPDDELDLIRGASEIRNISRFILVAQSVPNLAEENIKEIVFKTPKLSDDPTPKDKRVIIEFTDTTIKVNCVGGSADYVVEGVGAAKAIKDWFIREKLFTFARQDVLAAKLGYERTAIDNGLRDLAQREIIVKLKRGNYQIIGGSQSQLPEDKPTLLQEAYSGKCSICGDSRFLEFKYRGNGICRGCYDEHDFVEVSP